jgi:zinc protease
MTDAPNLSPRATRLLRLLVAWVLLVSLFAWLPLLRCLFDGDSCEWASGPWFGYVLRGAGSHGDLWYPVLKLAVFVPAVFALLRSVGARAVGPLPLAAANVRALIILGALLPLQCVLLQFGEPHGTTDAIGVMITIAQWFCVAAALCLVTTRDRVAADLRRRVRLAALVGIVGASATASDASAQHAPQWVQDVRVETLENGLTVLVAPDASVPHVSVELWLPTGLREDPPARRGMSHLFEHVLANTRLEIDTAGLRAARPRFADSNAQVRRDYARYFLLLDPSALDAGLALHAARLRLDPALITDSLVGHHRQVVLNEQRNAATSGASPTAALQRVYAPDHPYALPPETEASVAAVDAAMLREYLLARTAPQAAVLVLVGRFDARWALERVRAHFGTLEPRTPPAAVRVAAAPGTAMHERHVMPAGRIAQFHRRFVLPPLGDRVAEDAELALRWASLLASRALRHDLAWTVERTPGSLASDVTLSAATLPASLEPRRVADAVEHSLRQVARGVATADALDEARAAARLAIWKGVDRLGFHESRAEQLAEGYVLAGDARWLTQRLAQLDTVGPQSLATVAAGWLAGRGVEVLVPGAAELRAVAGASPAPIADGPSTDFVREPATDTVLGGLRVLIAPLRHVPIVRVGLSGPDGTVTTDIARDGLRQWLATLPSRPMPRRAMMLSVVGDVESRVLVSEIQRATAPWPAGAAPEKTVAEPFAPGDSTVAVPGRAQARLVAEWAVDVSDARRDVMAQLVARRLWQAWNLELRTRRGWSYGASYAVEVQGERAILRVAAEVRPDRVAEAVELVRGEIARLADGALAFPALGDLRESLVQAALLEASTVSGLERAIRADVAAGRSARFREERLAAARTLDAATVDAARHLVRPQGLRLTVIADPVALAALQFEE